MHRSARAYTKAASALLLTLGMMQASAHAQTFQRNVKFCNHGREALNVAAGFDRAGTSESTRKAGRSSSYWI